MRLNTLKAIIKTAARGAAVLLFGIGLAQAQTTVNLAAGPATATLPDGSSIPMWGYTCTDSPATPACAALKPGATAGVWSPVVITVPTGNTLTINLTNNLTFTPTGSTTANAIPTSLTIVGQLGGGLGGTPTRTAAPLHDNQGTTWPIANSGAVFTPPAQGARVQSFGTEVLPGAAAPTALTWSALRPGTYLLESGTHPSIQGPMGLYGIVVVTTLPASGTAGAAYTNVNYSAELPLVFSEIDPSLNNAISAAVNTSGFVEGATRGVWEAGAVQSVAVTNGGANYTSAPTVKFVGGGPIASTGSTGIGTGTAVIDPDPNSPTFGQVTAVNIVDGGNYTSAPSVQLTLGGGSGAAAAAALQVQANATSHCSGGAAACYPSVVNYTPLYYLINGVGFDKTHPTNSLFAVAPGATTTAGNVLVRLVNAGLHMHVPSIVGSLTSPALLSSTSTSTALPVSGFSLVAEDGNPLPGTPRVQNEVFMAPGKTYDVMLNTPAAVGSPATTPALPIYDRELSLSGNSIARDSGMLAYIGVNNATTPTTAASGAAIANPDLYKSVTTGQTLTISDPSKGVLGNDINVFGVKVPTGNGPTAGSLVLNANGTFTYTPTGPVDPTTFTDSFTYCGNGAISGAACALVTLGPAPIEAAGGISCPNQSYTASTAKVLIINHPGVLTGCTDAAGYPLTVKNGSVTPVSGLTVTVDDHGAFSASVSTPGAYSFTFKPQNSQGTAGATATVNLTFPVGSGLKVSVLDGNDKKTAVTDYRWILEEDRTFYVNPACAQNPLPAGCPTLNTTVTTAAHPEGVSETVVPNFGTNFHTSFMPVIATGCTGDISCANNQTVNGQPVTQKASSSPADVPVCSSTITTSCLDPNKRYYLSVLPGDAAQPFIAGYAGAPTNCATTGSADGTCGHGMGGAPIPLVQAAAACTTTVATGTTPASTTCTLPPPASHASQAITIYTEPTPFPPATLSAFVFEDDYPVNGEHDAGGGVDILSPNEPGLGDFQITLGDAAGGTGDITGSPTYDMFNMPLSNALAGTIDPVTKQDACPLAKHDTDNPGIVGMIQTCPKYEADGVTLSPLAGQVLVKNLYPGRYTVTANAGASRIAAGEEWLQTNTLDGQKAHDSFMRIGEPGYFQEFGPAGYHVTIGFANPKIINDRMHNANGTGICDSSTAACTFEVTGHVTTARMSRTPDERLYGSGDHTAYGFTQCYISLGDPDGADFAFQKCDENGYFDFKNIPPGNWKITTFDQWDDQVVDGITTPVGLCVGQGNTISNPAPDPTQCIPKLDLGEVAVHQWQADIYTRTFLDTNYSGVSEHDMTGVPCTPTGNPPTVPSNCNANFGNDTKPGVPLVATNIRFRDGSYSNFNNTDLNGYAGFNEVFPLFNWYTIETDNTRLKNTGTHVVYDAGGPADGTAACGSANRPCGNSTIAANLANTYEFNALPADLSVPGAVYCSDADCSGANIGATLAQNPYVGVPSSTSNHSTGRIDPAWVDSYGWQGFSGQANFLEFGKKPYAPGENGGIHGHVVYASTRPFDDPQLLLQLSWEPLIPHVKLNLYQEKTAPDGVTTTLTLVDHTETTSFDDWVQGFHLGPNGTSVPNMSCPGQGTDTGDGQDPYFWAALKGQPEWLDAYEHGTATTVPYGSQYKCYDGMHNWNQLQPAPYDGKYSFPSVTSTDPKTGKPTGSNCTICIDNPTKANVPVNDPAYDPFRAGTKMLPDGKYVVEVVVPPGYELVKEEDKNILIGDNYIAPVSQQFGGLGSVFILPDQAEIDAAYNANNAQNPTGNLGRLPNLPSHEADTGSDETFWPCVGALRTVPDFISLFPASLEVAPFAGASRNLCDRKEVTLTDQTAVLTKFYLFTETHAASHFTGVITDDFAAEFDPYSPQFGEKFAPAYLPVSIKDWAGNEVNRVYSDAWGSYNGLNYSTWEVNPPNPTGYGPTMMVTCMNDPGPIVSGGTSTVDPLFQNGYSNFCYELPYMPGQTGYFDTPVVPTSAFAGDYNTPDCAYPDATPAIAEVDGDGVGPWVSATGKTLTITALGDQMVDNYSYSGPTASGAPYNQQKIKRHYGFGTQCSAISSTCTAVSSVKIGGVPANIISWGDSSITVTVPATVAGNTPTTIPACSVQQQTIYSHLPANAPKALCGELVITTGTGSQSIDTVTVTVGGKAPTHIAASSKIQDAIDAASPGDLLIIDPTCIPSGGGAAANCSSTSITAKTQIASNAAHAEMLIMWKPVRLQGVGAASSVIDANPHPAGKLDPWRRQIVCLFGLSLNGVPITTANPYDAPGGFTCSPNMQFSVDRLPLEATVGWDATLNGNLAEQLIEPTIMGAYEGAGITVLGKGVDFHGGDPFASDVFPTGTTLLTASNCLKSGANPFPSNFLCNPSSIDGLTVKNSSQGGGGILLHGWNHEIQIANNRVFNNQGTLSGGITIGQGEHPDAFLVGGVANTVPGSCITNTGGLATNMALPYCNNMDVNVHNNMVIQNSSLGDELFSSTPAGAGGVTFCNGSDYYKFQYNWVCGNMSTGDGAGVAHIGLSWNGDIEHNSIMFNQSVNPSIVTNGGGLLIMGAPDADPPCGITTDVDCLASPGSVTPSDGTGPGLIVNGNYIVGNSADSGSGGGLRLQHINGNELLNFPNGQTTATWPSIPVPSTVTGVIHATPSFQAKTRWNAIQVTNNIIANNVAGIDGGGVSLLDALATDVINNTIIHNNSTASSGVLLQTLFAPLASSGTGGLSCIESSAGSGQSCPQIAGLVSVQNSEVLTANIAQLPSNTPVKCPANHDTALNAGACTGAHGYSVPELFNDLFWQNRSLLIGVGGKDTGGTGLQSQQNTVAIKNPVFSAGTQTGTVAPISQTATGACNDGGSAFWDIGVRGDKAPGNHSGGTLIPTYSVLTNSVEIGNGTNNLTATDPKIASTYCNGARVPVEAVLAGLAPAQGWQTPPGTNETNALPTPVFSLSVAATVDEGNNWINLRWGPLSLSVPTIANNNPVPTFTFNPSLTGSSQAINYVPSTAGLPYTNAPALDFYGNPRKTVTDPKVDVGAIEFLPPAFAVVSVSPTSLTFPATLDGATSTAQTLTLSNTGGALFTINALTFPTGFARAASGGTCAGTLNASSTCTINVVFTPGTTASGTVTGPLPITGTGAPAPVTGSPVTLTGTAVPQTHTATVTPSPLAFGNVARGATSILNLTVANTGNSALTGGTASTLTAPFSRVNNGTFPTGAPNCGGILAVGASCTIKVQFAPVATTPGPQTTTLSLAYAGATVTGAPVTITGTPTGPFLSSISPTSGVRGSTVPVTLTGTGLTGATAVTVSGSGVTCSGIVATTGTTITANCAITSGAALGSRTVSATVGGVVSNTVAFTVTGATVAFNPTGLTTTPPTTATKNGTVTVSNTGTGPFTFNATPTIVKATGAAGTGNFSITGGTCTNNFVLNTGSNCTILVRYTGQTVTSNATATLTISGTGAATATVTNTVTAN